MARYDNLVSMDGADVRARREALGFSRSSIAAEDGSPSESIWQKAEAGDEIAERSARRITMTLDRLESTEDLVLVPQEWLDRMESRIDEIARLLLLLPDGSSDQADSGS